MRAERVYRSWKDIPANKVTAWDVNDRLRLGSNPGAGQADHWVVYGRPNDEQGHSDVKPPAHYRWIANEVTLLLNSQAEPYWNARASAVEPGVAADEAVPAADHLTLAGQRR